MTFSLGVVGAGSFGSEFAELFALHPGVGSVVVTDTIAERATELVDRLGPAGTVPDVDALLASDVDAVAVLTQRWLHGPTVLQAPRRAVRRAGARGERQRPRAAGPPRGRRLRPGAQHVRQPPVERRRHADQRDAADRLPDRDPRVAFRWLGTEGSFEQLATTSVWQTRTELVDVTDLITTRHEAPRGSAGLDVRSGTAPIQDTGRIPVELLGAPNGNEGVHTSSSTTS